MNWSFQGGLQRKYERDDGHTLVVMIALLGETCQVIAIEAASVESLDKILGEHAHKNVGSYETFVEAIGEAEGYAGSWMTGSAVSGYCPCPELP